MKREERGTSSADPPPPQEPGQHRMGLHQVRTLDVPFHAAEDLIMPLKGAYLLVTTAAARTSSSLAVGLRRSSASEVVLTSATAGLPDCCAHGQGITYDKPAVACEQSEHPGVHLSCPAAVGHMLHLHISGN